MTRVFRFDCAQMSLGMAAYGQKRTSASDRYRPKADVWKRPLPAKSCQSRKAAVNQKSLIKSDPYQALFFQA